MAKYTLLVVCVLLAACDSPASSSAKAEVEQTYRFGEPANVLIDQIMAGDDPSLAFELMDREAELAGVVSIAGSAQDAADAAEAVVAGAPNTSVQAVLRESAAQRILARWGAHVTDADRAVIESATAVLVERRSTEAALVKTGLDAVGSRWTAERRRQAAASTLASIDAAGLRRCLLCSTGSTGGLSDEQRAMMGSNASAVEADLRGTEAQLAVQTARRDAAVRELERIAG